MNFGGTHPSTVLLSPYYKGGNRVTERLSHLPKITQLVGFVHTGEPGFEPWAGSLELMFFIT